MISKGEACHHPLTRSLEQQYISLESAKKSGVFHILEKGQDQFYDTLSHDGYSHISEDEYGDRKPPRLKLDPLDVKRFY